MLFFAPQGARARGQGSALRLVRAATVASVDLDNDASAGDVIDGVILAAGDYLLVKDQAAPAQNGVYVVKPTGAPVRATWADSAKDLDGLSVLVAEGTVNADTAWQQVEEDVHVGMGPVTWAPLAGAKLFQVLSERGQPGGYAPLDSDSRVPLGNTYRNTVSVRAATVGAGFLSGDFEAGDSIDGVVLSAGDSILIKDQTDEKENGVYSVNASGAPTRISVSLDGLIVFVREGSTQRSTLWAQTKSSPVPGADPISFVPTGATAPIAQKSGNYTVTPKDDTIVVDASAGPVTVTLPSASTVPGKPITVKKRDSTANEVTISGTVDGVVNPKLTRKDESKIVKSDGASFSTVGEAASFDLDWFWGKNYFQHHGLLPPVKVKNLYHGIALTDFDYDFQGTGHTLSVVPGAVRVTQFGNNGQQESTFGFNLGGSKSKVLLVVAASKQTHSQWGLFLGAVPAASTDHKSGYMFVNDLPGGSGGIKLVRANADNSLTDLVANGTNFGFRFLNDDQPAMMGLAIYFDGSGPEQRIFVRINGVWVQVAAATDATFATVAAAGFWLLNGGGANTKTWWMCPIQLFTN